MFGERRSEQLIRPRRLVPVMSQSTQDSSSKDPGWNCPACTYFNSLTLTSCEVCTKDQPIPCLMDSNVPANSSPRSLRRLGPQGWSSLPAGSVMTAPQTPVLLSRTAAHDQVAEMEMETDQRTAKAEKSRLSADAPEFYPPSMMTMMTPGPFVPMNASMVVIANSSPSRVMLFPCNEM